MIAYSSFKDVVGLKVGRKNEGQLKKKDDVVLIEKEEIFSLFEKMKEIESRFEMLSSNYTIKLE